MAIATKQVASGKLAQAVYQSGPNPYPVTMQVTAQSSEWFESFVDGTGLDQGTRLGVSIAINKTVLPATENLAVELFTCDDLLSWDYLATLVDSGPPPGGPPPLITQQGIFEATYDYSSGAPLKYLRLLFTLDENQSVVPFTLPYPVNPVSFEGSCWVTVSH